MDRIVGRFSYNKRPGMVFDKENPRQRSRTLVAPAKDANINTIVAKYKKTGLLADPLMSSSRAPIFADFSNGADFTEMQNRIASVRSVFETLPAEIRVKFSHDPAQLIDFLADPANNEEAVELGLLPKTVLPGPKPEDPPFVKGGVKPDGASEISAEPPAVGPTQ